MGDDGDEFVEKFHKSLGEVDALGQMVLNAHSQVEAMLNAFLDAAMLHPQYFEDNRVTFPDKVQIARALTPESHEHPD